ncbi:MAG: ribose-5-phosphate isomerase RpiA [Anaerolineae bacterium]|nr:ribose-5-phosphate isomerase RpiA [Anaerolineae bacterium]MDW8071770.1 ribose-5-phosphate isomerase RpiA [Anaerolineae bacterium]
MNLKQQAAVYAVDMVADGMVLGLGTGSTFAYALEELGARVAAGRLRSIVGVPTSEATARRARELGIPLTTLAEHPVLDMVIDGADEVDPRLDLIKGLGGALLREKIVAIAARRFVTIVDESKLVNRLGTRGPLPVEVVPFAWEVQARWLSSLGCHTELRRNPDGSPYVTDNHNFIVHCTFPEGIADPYTLDQVLHARPGIVEHGLFLGIASEVVVASAEGVHVLKRTA